MWFYTIRGHKKKPPKFPEALIIFKLNYSISQVSPLFNKSSTHKILLVAFA